MQGSLAETLRVLRARRGFTLTEAAERAGVQRQTLALLERGERHPHTPTLHKIAKGYGIPVEDLLEEPALVGKADAPDAGRPDSSETIASTVHDLVIKQDQREAQALNRLHESRQPQPSYGHDDHKAMMYLLKLPDKRGAVEEAYIDLMRSHVNLERENARLKEENAQLREESARAHVND